jgi:deazaflavin-dependent oxidoreductase (nitroreductase family)
MGQELTPSGTRGASVPRRFLKVVNRPVVALMRLFRGRRLRIAGQPLLLLTTTGWKSGHSHTVPLLWFPDGPQRWLVVASYGGSATHPAWYLNLMKRPQTAWAEVEGRRWPVAAEVLAGAEREAAWARIVAAAPVYQGYREKTDREIPVLRLQPAREPIDQPS